jgi:hypothetical protein
VATAQIEELRDGLGAKCWRVSRVFPNESSAARAESALNEITPEAFQPIADFVRAVVNPDALAGSEVADDPPESASAIQAARQFDHAVSTDGEDAPCSGPVCGVTR